ncbi:MAG: ribosome biogenesis GTPase Der [Phycisphaeraceae bacterium]|nr:ribosome biogenesis GTPase Der [Phycisphaeraceae bacterium]
MTHWKTAARAAQRGGALWKAPVEAIMLDRVVIVGRPNVGKSSIFNMLCGRSLSIVDPTPGVTRDRLRAFAQLSRDRHIELIDTGGYGIEDAQNLTADVERQIALGLAEADLILFVVDAQAGITPLDQRIARMLRSANTGKPILLVANKVDGEGLEPLAVEAHALGFGEPRTVSATTRYRRTLLVEAIEDALKRLDRRYRRDAGSSDRPDEGLRLAVVGKRNSGKSTLINAWAGEERVIVSELEGTTRDSVDVRMEVSGRVLTAIDTAGVRKRKSLADDIEFFSYHRSLRSVRRADVVVLVVDAMAPVSQVDKQLGNEIQKHFKPCIIAINKWDLARDQSTQDDYLEYLDKQLKGLSFAPIAFISAARAEGLTDLLAMAVNLHQQAGHRVGTGELNRTIESIVGQSPPVSKGGKRGRIYYATQLAVHPPTIGFWVNNPDYFDGTFQRFLLNRMRDVLPFSEVPIRLIFRQRQKGRDVAGEERAAIEALTAESDKRESVFQVEPMRWSDVDLEPGPDQPEEESDER